MIKHGPVDVVVLAAGEPRFDGGVFAELERQTASGTIRVLDAMILLKDDEGQIGRLDLEDLPAARPVHVSLKRGRAYKPSSLLASVPLAGRLCPLPLSLGEFSFPRGKGLSPQTPALSTP